MRCNRVPPEILRANRVVFRDETCARQNGHKGPHRTASSEWKTDDQFSVSRSEVLHAHVSREGVFGGTINTTLCGRMSVGQSGMNKAETDSGVTCKFCLRKISIKAKAAIDAARSAEAKDPGASNE